MKETTDQKHKDHVVKVGWEEMILKNQWKIRLNKVVIGNVT